MEQPDIEYAKSGDVSIAYQVIGDGPIDVLLVPFLNNLEYAWAHPLWPRVYERLAAFSRVIAFDKRGTGLSDRFSELPTLEVRMDDLRAVLDDAGSESAALLGSMEGNHLAALFAATYPERTSALVLYDPVARFVSAPDYPWGVTEEEWERLVEDVAENWGRQAFFDDMLRSADPQLAEEKEFQPLVRGALPARRKPGIGGRLLPDDDGDRHPRRAPGDPRPDARLLSRGLPRAVCVRCRADPVCAAPSSFPGSATSRARRRRCSTRSSAFSADGSSNESPIACCSHCSSPTSSGRRSSLPPGRSRLAGAAGETRRGRSPCTRGAPRPRSEHDRRRIPRDVRRTRQSDSLRVRDPRRHERARDRDPLRLAHGRVRAVRGDVAGIAVHTAARVAALAGPARCSSRAR